MMHNRPYVIDVGLPSRTDSGAFTNDGRPLCVVKVRLLVNYSAIFITALVSATSQGD